MRTELISIPTDGVPLDGALHLPDGQIKGSALYFHGNTMNFYTGAARFLAPALTAMGWAFLAFNRRGHDILTTRASRAAEGGAFQTVAESVADNRYAANWLAQQGHSNPVIIGHSYGGMLATRHVLIIPIPRRWFCSQQVAVAKKMSLVGVRISLPWTAPRS